MLICYSLHHWGMFCIDVNSEPLLWIWTSTWRTEWDETNCGMLDYVLFCLIYWAPPVTPKCQFSTNVEESGVQAALWALNWRRDFLQTGLNLFRHKWSSVWIREWVSECVLESMPPSDVVVIEMIELMIFFSVYLLCSNALMLPRNTDILYLYSCILVYEQCFVVTVVIV